MQTRSINYTLQKGLMKTTRRLNKNQGNVRKTKKGCLVVLKSADTLPKNFNNVCSPILNSPFLMGPTLLKIKKSKKRRIEHRTPRHDALLLKTKKEQTPFYQTENVIEVLHRYCKGHNGKIYHSAKL